MHITIVGGGFGGVKAALEAAKDASNQITLITDKPDFQYYPTLYSSATGRSRLESWTPLGLIFGEHPNIEVLIDTIESMDADRKTLKGESGTTYHYETLILAIGVVTTYFGIPGLETYSFGIKSEVEIKKLKQRIFIDIAERRELDRNYVIVGAGPTGVELAGALETYLNRLCKHYKVKKSNVKIRLIEAESAVLPRSSRLTQVIVQRRLKELGVTVELGKRVEREYAQQLIVEGKSIDSHTVIWTAGVANHPFFKQHPDIFTLAGNGKVAVDDYLRVRDDIYVIGDNANTPFSGQAQTALRDAVWVVRNFSLAKAGKPLKVYKPRRPVQAIPVGLGWAAIEWKFIRFFGWFGNWVRRAADFFGYTEILPFGTSLGAWRAARIYENDYFTPTVKTKRLR